MSIKALAPPALALLVTLAAATPSVTAQAAPVHRAAAQSVLGLDGLGNLKIGQPPPRGGSWRSRGGQEGEGCRTVTSRAYPGVYGMVVDGRVKRITAGQRSTVKLAEGFGVGAKEMKVRQWFGGFRAEPHKYEAAPAKYLTVPNAANGSSALRFEIGADRRVKMIHIGLMPELAYVEGCS